MKKSKKLNTSYQLPATSSGFTLIEAVISISVFATVMTSILGVYVSIQRLNRQSTALQALEQNIRFINEDLLKTIANGKIDYASYPAQTVPQPFATDLYLLDKDSNQIHVYQSGDYLIISKTGAASSNFSGREVKVLDFRVYVWPAVKPFPKTASTPKEQPTVTIYADVQSSAAGGFGVARLPFQTTVATREYPE